MTRRARPGMAAPADAVRRLAAPPLFDTAQSETILLAENEGQGWWVGAPSVVRTEAGYHLSLPRPAASRAGAGRSDPDRAQPGQEIERAVVSGG